MSPRSSDRPPSLLRNPLSFLGIAVALTATAFGLPLMFLDMFRRHTEAYLAVVIYLILPLVATFGVVIMLAGMAWERRRRQRHPGREVPRLPLIDLNRPAHQAALLGGALGALVLVALMSVTAYRSYHFTESVKFCGLVCHAVMKPEYVAHQNSPHARVACTECHVGEGAESYLRSKLNGLHQVYSLATHSFERPIPTPVKNLRPAQDTCEQCHWPAKFFGAQQKTFTHYLGDEANSPWQIDMLVKVGGGDPAQGQAAGIHWHMNIEKEIEYLAADERREVIPWVRVRERDGAETIYESADAPLDAAQVAAGRPRRMDCVDCHNRPTHIFRPPDAAVDQALLAGRLDRTLPYLKREAVRLLAEEYQTEAQALARIQEGLRAFYRETYPELAKHRAKVIDDAAEELGRVYARNLFPEMRADWRAHPNHAGHLNSPGCFRCHDGQHASADGRIITNDCNACHTIIAQGPPGELVQASWAVQPFRHPADLGVDPSELRCSDCHTGAGHP